MNFQLHFLGQNTKTFDISSFDSSGLGPFKWSWMGLILAKKQQCDVCGLLVGFEMIAEYLLIKVRDNSLEVLKDFQLAFSFLWDAEFSKQNAHSSNFWKNDKTL